MAELITQTEYESWLEEPVTRAFMEYHRYMSKLTIDTYISKEVNSNTVPVLNQIRGTMAIREAIVAPDFYEVINNSGEISNDAEDDVRD